MSAKHSDATPDDRLPVPAAPAAPVVRAVPQPSTLPPNPSVGELVTEIDRARHDAAHTMTALVEKLDVKARVKHETNRKLTDLQARRQRLMDSTPESVAKAMGKAAELAKRVPVPAQIGAVVLLLVLLRRRRHH